MKKFISLFLFTILIFGCGGDDWTDEDNKEPVVFEVNYAICSGNITGDTTATFDLIVSDLTYQMEITQGAAINNYHGNLGFDGTEYGFIYNETFNSFIIKGYENENEGNISGEWHNVAENEHGFYSGNCEDIIHE